MATDAEQHKNCWLKSKYVYICYAYINESLGLLTTNELHIVEKEAKKLRFVFQFTNLDVCFLVYTKFWSEWSRDMCDSMVANEWRAKTHLAGDEMYFELCMGS